MNLNAIAAACIAPINPPTEVTLYHSTGYTTNDDGSRVPAYDDPIVQMTQVQELTKAELRLVEGLNLQGSHQAVYLEGVANGVVRRDGFGGDLMTFRGTTWKIATVIEQWDDWMKCIVTMQLDPVQ